MTAVVAPVAALLLSVALLLMGSGLQGTLLPIRAGIEGYSALDIGMSCAVWAISEPLPHWPLPPPALC